MSFVNLTRQQKPDTNSSTNQTPGSQVNPEVKAPLKTQPTDWTRTFTGQAKGVSFEIKIQRDASGYLHGRYIATPGNPAGWHLEGQIRQDNTFALKGTENQALFEGSFDPAGVTLTSSFRNKDFQVEKLQLKRKQGKISLNSGQQVATPTTAPSSTETNTSQGALQQNGDVKHWSQTLTPEMRKRLPALAEPEFLPALNAMCKRLNIPVDMLLAVMTFESADAKRKTRGLDPKADNGLGYYGLIQFGEDAARDEQKEATFFATLNATQQLVYVERFLLKHGLNAALEKAKAESRPLSLEELYMSILGGHTSAAYKTAWKTKKANPKGYKNNIGLDSNHDGKITPTEAADAVRLHWRDVYGNNLDERSRHLEREWYVENGKRKWRTKEHTEIYSSVLNGPITGTTTTTPVATPTRPPTANQPALTTQITPATQPPQSKPSTDPRLSPLDRLLGLPMAKATYTDDEIVQARQLIAAQPKPQQREYYLDLQTKTVYRNQRNNRTLDNGVLAGDDMCNVTSLAMCLDALGIGKPKNLKEHNERFKDAPKLTEEKLLSMQYEDYLDLLRRHYKLGPRTSGDTLARLARRSGGEWKYLVRPGNTDPWSREQWKANAEAALGGGNAVIFSIRGHIVRLDGITDDGLRVDDPFGHIKLFRGSGDNAYSWVRGTNPRPETGRTGEVGKDNIWPWQEIENHCLWWLGVVSKQ